MNLFVVIGVWYHEDTELLGIYDSMEKAIERKRTYPRSWHDEIKIEEIELNQDINNY